MKKHIIIGSAVFVMMLCVMAAVVVVELTKIQGKLEACQERGFGGLLIGKWGKEYCTDINGDLTRVKITCKPLPHKFSGSNCTARLYIWYKMRQPKESKELKQKEKDKEN